MTDHRLYAEDNDHSAASEHDEDPVLPRVRAAEQRTEDLASDAAAVLTPLSNERLSQNVHTEHFGQAAQIRMGKVTWTAAYTRWCRVDMGDGRASWPCCIGTDLAPNPLSIKNISVLAPNTQVLVWDSADSAYGTILCCVPNIMTDGSKSFSDYVSQGSNGGFRREKFHKDFPELFERNGGVIDFSGGQPCDTAVGDFGYMDDLGGGLFMDLLAKWFRVDESCGIFLSYLDRLTRLSGNNLDVNSAIHELHVRQDEGEGLLYEGSTAYPWEALGALKPGEDSHRETTDDDVHYNKPYGKYEPAHDDQQPFYRYEQYQGYLGQAYMRQVVLPPQTGTVNRFQDTDTRIGVFRESIGMDGGLAVASAQSLVFEKRSLLPVPKRIKAVEDPEGDDSREGSYKFAGQYGDGAEHKIQEAPTATGELKNLLRATAVQDLSAYLFTWKTLHPFHYHAKDFVTPEQTDLSPLTSLQQEIPFDQLKSRQWLDEPAPVELKVDHRYTTASYYESRAGLYILPDGSVVIRDGYGAETRWSGGSIQNSAPGDIWHQAGKNVNCWAGDDVVLKAHNSMDLSTTKHDIRLKAERNLEGVAGNNGAIGRILWDCQAASSSHDVEGKEGEDVAQTGVIMKAAKSEVIQWGQGIYLRTGGGDVLDGPITFDASKGKADVRTHARAVYDHVENGAYVAIPAEDPKTTYVFAEEVCHLPAGTYVEGPLNVTKQGIQVRGNIAVIEGQVSSDTNTNGLVPQWTPADEGWELTDENLLAGADAFQTQNSSSLSGYAQHIEEQWRASQRPGNATIMEQSQFAPRSPSQMNTVSFKLPENYWHQLQTGSPTWTEKEIKYQGRTYMPYPGKKAWAEDSTFYRGSPKLHTNSIGLDAPLSSGVYEDAELNPWTTQVLDGNYPVSSS